MKHWKSKFLLATVTVTLLAGIGACSSDDESADPGQTDGTDASTDARNEATTGNDGAPPKTDAGDAGTTDSGRDSGGDAADAGVDSGVDAAPPCGLPADDDPKVKVRFINAMTAGGAGTTALTQAPGATVRLWVNDAPLDLPFVEAHEGAGSVTPYVRIDPGTVTFSARTADDAATPLNFALDPMPLEAGARLTIVATGSSGAMPPTLLALNEKKLATPTCDEIGLRFVAAHQGSAAANNPSFFVDDATNAAATLGWAQTSAEEGTVLPSTTGKITVTVGTQSALGPTGKAPFTLPAGLLAPGRSYLVLQTGWYLNSRKFDDERSHRLLFVPVGDETPATVVKRDPLVYFFHGSPPATPGDLDVFAGDKRLAIHMMYAAAPTYNDLPPAGATLKLLTASNDGTGTPVLENSETGALEPGGLYLAVLGGFSGQAAPAQLRMIYSRVTPPLSTTSSGRTMSFVHASANAPANVDLGYWTNGQGAENTFTSVLSNAAYGAAGSTAGVAFPAPAWSSASNQIMVGVQSAGDPTSNRSALASGSTNWFASVLVGDWNSTDPGSAPQLVMLRTFGGTVGVESSVTLAPAAQP